MNKTARIINSVIALITLACLTSQAMAGESITQAKVNQITTGVTTEQDLVRAFGSPATKMVSPLGEVTLDWIYVSPIAVQNYVPVVGPALGGMHIDTWELWVVLRANGAVKRYIAYEHYVTGETNGRIEHSYYSTETAKNIEVGNP
jgi:outer membrane protein assembly factor BamE (lipoprotein component of BamABCDE complex)